MKNMRPFGATCIDQPVGRPASGRFAFAGLVAELSSTDSARDCGVDVDRLELLDGGALSDVSTSSFWLANRKRNWL